MSRRTARKHAFFLIFQFEFHSGFILPNQIELYFQNKDTYREEPELCAISTEKVTNEDKAFINDEVNGVYDNIERIDSLISNNLSGWEIDRINKTDLAILRLAVYEMLFVSDIPNGVSINEAVELAKVYGTDESYQFINGILGNIYEFLEEFEGVEKDALTV